MSLMEKIKASKLTAPVATIVIIAVVVFAFYQMRNIFGSSSAAAASDDRIYIDSETGKSFHISQAKLQGVTVPIYSSSSGKNTAYPAELCFWTKDGQPKSDPTPVLLNSWIGKTGPTFCPDCGRLVVAYNPRPQPGKKPPLTQAEYETRHGGGSSHP